MLYKTSVLSKFPTMQDLGNNNLIILDPLGNICEKVLWKPLWKSFWGTKKKSEK